MITWIEIWGLWSPSQHLKLVVVLRGLVLMLTCTLLELSAVDRGQDGHPERFAAMQPYMQQTVMYCVSWRLSIRTGINSFSNLSKTTCQLDRTTHASLCLPHAPLIHGHQWPCHRFTNVPSSDRYWPLQTEKSYAWSVYNCFSCLFLRLIFKQYNHVNFTNQN